MSKSKKAKSRHIVRKILVVLLIIILAFDIVTYFYHSNPSDIKEYKTSNSYIVSEAEIAGHRSGGGIEPEETMAAFKNCAENKYFSIDVFEFDLHITKDNVLVLLHDDTLDRTSDSEFIFDKKGVKPEDVTYSELRRLNMGISFKNENDEMPYKGLHGNKVPNDVKILRVEDVLDYLIKQGKGKYQYIIEIKNEGDLGKKGVDLLYQIMKKRNIINKVIFGTFHSEVSEYVDKTYPDMTRSTSIPEVLEFYKAAIKNDKNYVPPCSVLQIPYCFPYKYVGLNLATSTVINYAHSHNMAVQYWTIDSEKDMKYLISLGADCIMTNYPDKLYNIEK